MSRFRIDIQNVEREATNMDSICKDVRQIGSSIQNISNQLSINGLAGDALKAKLNKMHEEIISNAVKVNTLQGALREVAASYLKAEQQVVGNSVKWQKATNAAAVVAASASFIDKIRQKIKEIIERIKSRIKKDNEKVTKAQEQAHDKYMKDEIAKIQSRYADKWNNATASQREKLLKDYMSDVCKIMGIDVKTLNWTSQAPQNGYVTLGYYNPSSNGVWVNKWAIANYGPDLLTTVTHELRHAYQHQAIDHPEKFKVSPETIKEWKDSFNNYMSMDGFKRKYGLSDAEAFQRYRDQSVERDARSFAGQQV